MKFGKEEVNILFSDFSGGVNLSEDMNVIRKNQVQVCVDAILRKNGIQRPPGRAVLGSFDLTAPVQGMFNYQQFDATEKLHMISGGKLYDVNKTSGAPGSSKFDMTGSANAYAVTYLDKNWICNSAKVIKVENATAYQVGITAPSGVAVQAKAGGSLPDGTYTVFASYGRGNNLYSQGESLGAVVLSGGNNTIEFTSFPNSADAQVSNKVVWITEPSGTITYFYHETGNNTTTAFDITDDSGKNTTLTYGVLAVNNQVPGAFEYIHAFDGRLMGSIANVVHYSLKNVANVFDLERFFSGNTLTLEFDIQGIFHLGKHLFFNTPQGIIKIHNSDFNSQPDHVERRWYFKYWNTVVDYRGGKLGLTNDGVKLFDGEKFIDYDMSIDVRPEIEKIYNSTAGFEPCGVIFRRGTIAQRTEYHLTYNDDNLSTTSNNARLVLNLNKLEFLPEKKVIAPWEQWTSGATHMVVDKNENFFNAQSHASLPKLYTENNNNTYNNGIYKNDGTVGGATDEIYLKVETRAVLVDMKGRMEWQLMRTMIKQAKESTFTLIIRDVFDRTSAHTIGTGEGGSLWAEDADDVGGMVWDVDVWDTNTLGPRKTKLPRNMKGYIVYIRMEQTANDPNYNIQKTEINGVITLSRYT